MPSSGSLKRASTQSAGKLLGIGGIVAITNKSPAIAIKLKEAMLSPYPERSITVFENRSR